MRRKKPMSYFLSYRTGIRLVKEVLPDAGKAAGAILWNHTGFPQFWNIPEDGDTPAECCRKQVEEFARGDRVIGGGE